MSINKDILYRKINLINKDLSNLRKLSYLSFKDYLKNPEYEVLAERYLERIIGRMIDINYHILSELNEINPVDYFSSFVEMGKNNYISIELSEKLKKSAGLRNRLAHEYDDIDEKKIYEAIKKSLKEIPEFLRSIIDLLEKDSKQTKMF